MTVPKSISSAKTLNPVKTPLQINKQVDFAAICESSCDSINLKKISASLFEVVCIDGTTHRTYEIIKDGNDDYFKIGAAYVGGIFDGDNVIGAILLSQGSNKEFAISITANGETQWIPDHGVGVAFAVEAMSIEVDGIPIDWVSMANNAKVAGEKIVVRQHCYCRFSNVNIAEFRVDYTVGLDSTVKYGWAFKALQVLHVNTAYSLMLPTNQDVLLTAVTALKNSITSSGDESTIYFTEEKQLIKSAGWLSSTNVNYIAGGTTGNPENTMFVWQRALEPKIYFRPVSNIDLVTGDVLTGNGIIGVAEITNIYGTIMQ